MVSDSPGLVDFAIWLVNSVCNLPDGQVIFFEEFEKQKNFEINSALQKAFGLVEMTSGLINVSFNLPEWQAVKMIFFATCVYRFLIVVDSPVMYVLTLYSTKYGLFTFYMCKGKQNRKEETLRRVAVVTNFWIAMNLGPAKMVEKKN